MMSEQPYRHNSNTSFLDITELNMTNLLCNNNLLDKSCENTLYNLGMGSQLAFNGNTSFVNHGYNHSNNTTTNNEENGNPNSNVNYKTKSLGNKVIDIPKVRPSDNSRLGREVPLGNSNVYHQNAMDNSLIGNNVAAVTFPNSVLMSHNNGSTLHRMDQSKKNAPQSLAYLSERYNQAASISTNIIVNDNESSTKYNILGNDPNISISTSPSSSSSTTPLGNTFLPDSLFPNIPNTDSQFCETSFIRTNSLPEHIDCIDDALTTNQNSMLFSKFNLKNDQNGKFFYPTVPIQPLSDNKQFTPCTNSIKPQIESSLEGGLIPKQIFNPQSIGNILVPGISSGFCMPGNKVMPSFVENTLQQYLHMEEKKIELINLKTAQTVEGKQYDKHNHLSDYHLEHCRTKKLHPSTYEALFTSMIENIDNIRAKYLYADHPKGCALADLPGIIYFLLVVKGSRKPPYVGYPFRSYTDSHYTSVDRDNPIICKVKEWPSASDPTNIWRLYHYYLGNKKRTPRKRQINEISDGNDSNM